MNLQIILIIIGLALVFLLAFKLLKGIIKAVISVVIISIILLGIFGIIVYTDTVTLKKGLEGEKTIIITENQLLITAFNVGSNVTVASAIKQEFYNSLSPDEIDKLFEKIEKEDFKELEEKGLLLVIEQKVFYNEEMNLLNKKTINEKTLQEFALTTNSEDAVQILKDANIITEMESLVLKERNLHEIKSEIYYALFATKLKETKGQFIVKEIKDENIHIRPELLSMKMMNYFPKRLMNKMMPVIEEEEEEE
jgi:hypothetical protein